MLFPCDVAAQISCGPTRPRKEQICAAGINGSTMAMTAEENERLTRVGPGTPGGELLRRYWQPVAAALELADNPVKLVRLLGEDLVLYRTREGAYGLIDTTCPHRCASLEFGVPEAAGLRC